MQPISRGTYVFLKSNVVRLIIILGIATQTPTVIAQSPGTFAPTSAMTTPRFGHTATLLPDGKVLIAAGSSDDIAADLGFGSKCFR